MAHSGTTQGTFSDHTGNIQRPPRDHSGNQFTLHCHVLTTISHSHAHYLTHRALQSLSLISITHHYLSLSAHTTSIHMSTLLLAVSLITITL
jgi:hypothetical protein